jgi:hypothetical protein
MAGRDQHRPAGVAQGLHQEAGGFAGDLILLEEVAGAGDQVSMRLSGTLHNALEGGPQVPAAPLRANAIEALAGEGPVEMQVSEMEQAKGHKSPVTTRIVPGAMAYASAKAAPIIKVGLSLFRISRSDSEQRLH